MFRNVNVFFETLNNIVIFLSVIVITVGIVLS